MKRLLLFALCLGSSNAAFAGICEIFTPKNGVRVVLSQIATNQAGCVEAVTAVYGQSGKIAQAFYSSSSQVPLNLETADVHSMITVSEEKLDLFGPEKAREGCMGSAQYRGLLKATFSSARGLDLNPTGATPQECFKSAMQNYVSASARGTSLDSMSFAFKVKNQIRVGVYMSTPLRDASFIKEAFEREL